MADNYDKLTEAEKAYWDIYTRLRELSDWAGFGDAQKKVQSASRDWLVNQRKEIWRAAQPKADGGDGGGWDKNQRSARYEQLKDDKLNNGSCRRVAQLPTNAGTPSEKANISEREMWWRVSSVDDQTKSWRQANADRLTNTRKSLYTLAKQTTWDRADRKARYNNLCIATKTGKPYESWSKTHNTTTGKTNPPPSSGPSAGKDTSSRGKAVSRARSYLGTSEHPPGSNRGTPQPSGWQKRVIGSDGYAWCACFTTCMAWDAGVKGGSSAGVVVCMTMAQRAVGMYRGWTTDPSKVMRGDFAVIGCSTCHIEMVVDNDDAYHTIGGNTSPGTEGSQYNGGTVAEKHRGHGEVIGWCLVDYPD